MHIFQLRDQFYEFHTFSLFNIIYTKNIHQPCNRSTNTFKYMQIGLHIFPDAVVQPPVLDETNNSTISKCKRVHHHLPDLRIKTNYASHCLSLYHTHTTAKMGAGAVHMFLFFKYRAHCDTFYVHDHLECVTQFSTDYHYTNQMQSSISSNNTKIKLD